MDELAPGQHELLEAYRRTFLDWAGVRVLEHLRSIYFTQIDEEMLREIIYRDVPDPFRGYMLIGIQRAIAQMEAMTAMAEAEALAGDLEIIEPDED